MAALAVAALVVSAAKAYNQYESARKAGKSAKNEKQRLEALRAELRAVPVPELQAVYADYPELEGDLVELIKEVPVEKLDDTKMSGITVDPRLEQAQYQGLDTLDEISKEGMTQTDKYALDDIRQTAARDEASQRGAAMQALSQRGLGGSGAEISSRLLAQQGGANRGAQQAMELAKQKRAASLNAVMQRAGMSSDMRNQQFTEKSDVAKAQDAIANFNATAQNKANDSIRKAHEAQLAREDKQRRLEHEADLANQAAANQLEQDNYNNTVNQINPNGIESTAQAQANADTAASNAEAAKYKGLSDIVAAGEKRYNTDEPKT